MVKELDAGRAMTIVARVWEVVRGTLDSDIVAAVDELVDFLYGICESPVLRHVDELVYGPDSVKARLRSGKTFEPHSAACVCVFPVMPSCRVVAGEPLRDADIDAANAGKRNGGDAAAAIGDISKLSAWKYLVKTLFKDANRARMAFPAYPHADGTDRHRASLRFTNNWVEAYHRFLKDQIRCVAMCADSSW
jgi:hypothetical protein